MIYVRAAGPPETDLYWEESLAFVRMATGAGVEASNGWQEESARLFAIDAALVVIRGNMTRIEELDRQAIANSLNEARRLVVDKRDNELGHLLYQLESRLTHSWSANARHLWLTAMNALLPSPYRAAQTTVESAYRIVGQDSDRLSEQLAERLMARVGEGSLMNDRSTAMFASA